MKIFMIICLLPLVFGKVPKCKTPNIRCIVNACDPRFRKPPVCAQFFPDATCVAICSGCIPIWFETRKLKKQIKCSNIVFPQCDNPVNCLIDPCDPLINPSPPRGCPRDLTCVSNFCGGCNAVWANSKGQSDPCVPCASKKNKICRCRRCKLCKKKFRPCNYNSVCTAKGQCCCCKKRGRLPPACMPRPVIASGSEDNFLNANFLG